MPTRVEVLIVLGPLAYILPLVFLVMSASAAAFVAARTCGRAVRERHGVVFLVAWLAALACVVAAWLAWNQLQASGARPAPFSLVSVFDTMSPYRTCLLALVGTGGLVAGLLRWFPLRRRDASAAAELRPDRARRIGAAGESLVACELADLGWPTLRNVILADGRRMAEIDHLVRVAYGILILETKTFSGFVTGSPDSPHWTQHLDGRSSTFFNPALQNAAHVRAVERFVGDPALNIWGFVVSAGRARFADEIARIPVPLAELGAAVRSDMRIALADQSRIDSAWRRLEREAAVSAARRPAHLSYVRGRLRRA